MNTDLYQSTTIRLTSFETTAEDGTKFRFQAPKGQVFVAILVGTEKKIPQSQEDLLMISPILRKILKNKENISKMPLVDCKLTGVAGKVGES